VVLVVRGGFHAVFHVAEETGEEVLSLKGAAEGALFAYILEYLRNGVLDGVPKEHLCAIKRELQFYSIPIPGEMLNIMGGDAKSTNFGNATNADTDNNNNNKGMLMPTMTQSALLLGSTIRQWAIIKCTSSLGNTWIVTSSSFSKEYYGINGWIEALNSLSSKGYQLHKFYQHDTLDKQTIWMYREEPSHKHH